MEQADLLRYVAAALDRLQIPYAVTGSMASIMYGEPRMTLDIDVVIRLTTDAVPGFLQEFPESQFYLSEDAVKEAVRFGGMFNAIHPESGLKIDFVQLTALQLDRERLQRARRMPIGEGATASFVSPEDLILKKLEFFVEGGSEKHLRDIGGILKVSGQEIDHHYVEAWAQKLDVLHIWQRLTNETGQARPASPTADL